MSTIVVEYRDAVAVAKLNRGVTNALDPELVNELGEVLRTIEQDSGVNGLVLASASDKFFSIGFDLPKLFEFPRPEFEKFFGLFNRVCLSLYTLSKPTVAAITGHATAGGCILALCCDYRFIAAGRKLMGLNEIKLGVPIPCLPDSILRYVVGVRNARDIIDSGEFYESAACLKMGLVDEVLPIEEVLTRAVEKARSVGSSPREAFALTKRSRVEEVERRVLTDSEEQDRVFLDCWYSAEARRRLRETIKKF